MFFLRFQFEYNLIDIKIYKYWQFFSFFFPIFFLKMEEKTFLCTCISCLKENSNGVLLNLNTYNRHRKKQQTREDSLIKQFHSGENHQEEELSIDDIRQDDIYQEEELPIDDIRQDNIHQEEELPIDELDKNSDIESFDEDNKYYSDYIVRMMMIIKKMMMKMIMMVKMTI